MRGTLYGIGVGPGDPELMTLKAVKTAESCDVIALPHKDMEKCIAFRIALGAIPSLKDKEILTVEMPMTKDKVRLEEAHTNGAKAVASVLDEGKSVAFLTLGDPTVYSTYMYVHQKVEQMGYDTCIIPGITSFCAAAAKLGTSLGETSQQIHIIPGTYEPEDLLNYPGVKVLMKNDIPRVKNIITDNSLKAMMVENCGMPDEKIYPDTASLPDDAGYYSLLIVKD